MSSVNFLEKLLDGAGVEWQSLEQVATIRHGKDWKGLKTGESLSMDPAVLWGMSIHTYTTSRRF